MSRIVFRWRLNRQTKQLVNAIEYCQPQPKGKYGQQYMISSTLGLPARVSRKTQLRMLWFYNALVKAPVGLVTGSVYAGEYMIELV